MRWEDEPWIKLYTRDTVTWRRWTWEARTVFLHLLRKVDRSGIIELGDEKDAAGAISLLIDVPPSVVDRALPQLLAGERPSVVVREGVVVLPAFIEAQSSSTSANQRARVHRERKRDYARAKALGVVVEPEDELPESGLGLKQAVTPRDATITFRDQTITKRDVREEAPEREPRLNGKRGTTAGTFGRESGESGFEPGETGIGHQVTKRDASVTERDVRITKRDADITDGHAESRMVTNRREEKRREELSPISASAAQDQTTGTDSDGSAVDPSGDDISHGLSLTLSPPETPKPRGGQRTKAETQRHRAEELWDWYEDTRIKRVQRARRRVATKQQLRQLSDLLLAISAQLGCSAEESEVWFRRFGEGVIQAAVRDESSRPYSCDDGTFRVNRWNNWYARNEKAFAKPQRLSAAPADAPEEGLSDVDRIRAQREKWAAQQEIPDSESLSISIPN